MNDLKNLFDEIRNKENTKADNRSKNASKLSEDPRFIHFKEGATEPYRFRLLYKISQGSSRKSPFILRNTHAFYDEVTKTYSWITCPTSEYLLDETKEGFSSCTTCSKLGPIYKNIKTSPSAGEIYNKFKRAFNGYAVVYVINDPLKKENNGKVKIIRFGVKIKDFLKKEVFGVIYDKKTKKKIINDDAIGIKAFDINDGYTLSIQVTKVGEFNNYDTSFSRNTSKIDISEEEIEKQFNELNFDKDFYTSSTPEQLSEFAKLMVEPDMVSTNVISSSNETVAVSESSNKAVEELESIISSIKENVPSEIKSEEASTKKNNEDVIDMDNIENILQQVEKDYNNK